MGGIYWRWGGSPPQAWGGLEHLDSWPTNVLGLHRLQASLTSLDTCMKQFSKILQTLAGWPHFGSVGLGLCATPSPHVVLSMTMSYFRHNEDMHGFWSIWCFSVVQYLWNGKSTKLVELVSNKHLSSISWMKFGYVCGRYVYFMTANTPHAHT
jgi:hypothetical protein